MNEKEREQIERAAKAGFTLMEVMVAVMIVGLLTALAVTNVGRYMRRANVTATQQQIVTISQAITQYQFEHNSKLPETLEALTRTLFESGEAQRAEETAQLWSILCDDPSDAIISLTSFCRRVLGLEQYTVRKSLFG